jgi:hypothetical protein
MIATSKKYPDLKSEIKFLTDEYYTEKLTDVVKKSILKLIVDTKPKLIKTTNNKELSLEFTLKNSQKKDCISYIESNQDDFPKLVKLSISDNQPYSWRASWLLSSCMKNNDHRVKKHIQKIIDILLDRQNNQQWSLLRVLQRMELESKHEGQLFDTCTKIWQNINNNPSLRFQAFKIIINISSKYPDFTREIKLLIDNYYTDNLSDILKKSIFRLIRNDYK